MVTVRRLDQLPIISPPPPDSLLYVLTDPTGDREDHAIAFEDVVEAVGLLGQFAILGVDTEQIFGGSPNPNGASHRVPITVATHSINPQKVIEQHFVGFSLYSGTPGGAVGTLQGGSHESSAFADVAAMGTVLGFEGIGRAAGTGGQTVTEVIGNEGSSSVDDAVTVTNLVSLLASSPIDLNVGPGTPTVTNAMSLLAFEPAVGTNRYTIKAQGRTRLTKGAHAHVLELANVSDLLQWSSDGSLIYGYASDGASVRLTLDPSDGSATGRIISGLFGSGKHVSLANGGSEVIGIGFDGKFTLAAAVDFILDATTGSKIGTAVSQKIGFWNATPIVQPAGASQVASVTTASTQTTPWGFSTQAQADGIITLLNAIRLALVNAGFIKGAA